MIVKFDHISYICDRRQKQELLADKGIPNFEERNLQNLHIKKALMGKWQSTHDLYFYEGGFPTEYIFYDTVHQKSKVRVDENKIYGQYADKEKALDFLRGIFGKQVQEYGSEIICNMKGVLDKRDYILVLQNTDGGCQAFLDDSGYGIPALIVSSSFSKQPLDGICTEAERITVNGRNMEICFTKSDATNIILEMITIVH